MPIYGITVGFVLTDSVEDVKSYYPEFNSTRINGHCLSFEHKGDDVVVIVINPKTATHGTIAHEIYHATSYICLSRGIVADFNNDEPMAYIAGWLTNKFYSLFKQIFFI
jgi:hypothetical protein